MTQEEAWRAIVDNNSAMSNGDECVRISKANLRKLFDFVWSHAQRNVAEETLKDIPDFIRHSFMNRSN